MMKRLIVIVAILSLTLSMGNVWAGAQGTGLAGDHFGQGKFDSDPQRSFRLVRFLQGAGTGASGNRFVDCKISADSIVVWNLTEDDGVTVMLQQGANLAYVAGVLATTCDSETTAGVSNTVGQDIGKNNWAWMQTYGKCSFINDGDAAIQEGAAVGTGRYYGTVRNFIASTTSGSNPATGSANGKAGFAYDGVHAGTITGASLNGAKFEGFIRLE